MQAQAETGAETGAARPGWHASRRWMLVAGGVFLAVMALVAGAFYLARSERAFVSAQWEKRLRVSLADPLNRTAGWLREGRRGLAEIAANDTVKLYLSELQAAGFDAAALPHGDTQRAFVSSYIVSAGADGPFASQAPQAPAGRMAPLASAGLALFDGQHRIIASTPGYRPSASLLGFFIRALRRGRTDPIVMIAGGRPTLVFFRPIGPVQRDGPVAPIGYLIGARDVDGGLQAALSSPLSADGGRIVLLARDGDHVRYLTASDTRNVPATSQELSLAGLSGDLMAARAPGRLERGPDVSGQDALSFAEGVDGSPLVLVASVPAEIALAGVSQRERALLTALLLAIVALVAVAIAFNRHQVGVTAARLAEANGREMTRLARREALLKAVVNAHPGALLLIRGDKTVALASARFAGELGMEAEALAGKPLAQVLPSAWRRAVLDLLDRRSEATSLRSEFRDGQGRWYVALIAFLSETLDPAGAALLLVDDITEQVRARERRTQVYRGIVAILLEAIDRRDPAAAAHSRRTGALARQIALRLGSPDADVEAADLAGSLQGVGKLFVPEELLRKSESLSAEERQAIADGAERWLSLLSQISVDYPVAVIARQAHEIAEAKRVQAEDRHVLQQAYIVAAANIFVALTSPRAYRPARTPQDALAALKQTLPELPDAVLAALRQIIEAQAQAD